MRYLILFVVLLSSIFITNCANEETFSCTYTEDGSIPACFFIDTDDDGDIKTACSGLNGVKKDEGCTAAGSVGICTGATPPLAAKGIGVNLGAVNYTLYSPAPVAAAQNLCTTKLKGKFATP